ncbi:hypothetical protein OF117_07420 [Geodermatophilus sp. YIM 151500]|uniref:hypothetical protein n=1 Tax=Geodermatophilus sp. YIM 151500 TaxID=2984531 RepID=UPI0021E4B56A|nr:hypothetical protein [Geodermatophilus sp. YIM 151500]MCV2489190.1 hypothetical protein [Geodermatophilus sp. YIM 151500]
MIEIRFTSQFTLEEALFDRIDRFVDLMTRIDQQLPADSDLRGEPTYQALLAQRQIHHFSLMTSALPEDLSSPTGFSDATIRARIEAGYEDAVHEGISRPGDPALRPGDHTPGTSAERRLRSSGATPLGRALCPGVPVYQGRAGALWRA